MKKMISATLAAALLVPLASAPATADPDHGRGNDRSDQRDRGDRGDRGEHRGWDKQANYRAWRAGQRFDQRYATNYQVIDYRRYHRLRPPPRGYRWVRSGNDAVLVAITSGLIASVIANSF